MFSHYEKLINHQKETQSKFYETVKQLQYYELLSDFDYVKWNQTKTAEVTAWNQELEILSEYKHQIINILNHIEDGSAEKSLIEEEKQINNELN